MTSRMGASRLGDGSGGGSFVHGGEIERRHGACGSAPASCSWRRCPEDVELVGAFVGNPRVPFMLIGAVQPGRQCPAHVHAQYGYYIRALIQWSEPSLRPLMGRPAVTIGAPGIDM